MAFGGIIGKATTNWTNEEILSTTTAQSLGLSAGATPDAAFGALDTKIGGAIASQLLYEGDFQIKKDGNSWSNTFGNNKSLSIDYNTLGFIFLINLNLSFTHSGREVGYLYLRCNFPNINSYINLIDSAINDNIEISDTCSLYARINGIKYDMNFQKRAYIQIPDAQEEEISSSDFYFNYITGTLNSYDNSGVRIINNDIHYRVYALKTNF